MPPSKSTASPTPGPSATTAKDLKAITVALYNWCRINYDEEHILSQKDLLQGDIIPNKDPNLLLRVTQSLLNDRLFRTHELRSGGIGWKIVSHVSAEKYKDLSSDESLVYSVIESAGRAGAWVKTIKSKLNLHQKNVDQSIKTLLQRAYIKSMSTVKYPNRKMYILAGLQPGEDATGGAWFTDGVLDHDLLEWLAHILEKYISNQSWKLVSLDQLSASPEIGPPRKRKEPHGGFDAASRGKAKLQRQDEEEAENVVPGARSSQRVDSDEPLPDQHQGEKKRHKKTHVPHPAGYAKYPTLPELTNYVRDGNFVQIGTIPQANISQLLDIMAYDDRIVKIPPSTDGATPTMFKARKNPAQLGELEVLVARAQSRTLPESEVMEAIRELEIRRLGNGGVTEVPCGRCPVFDMCEVGGPVNPCNCDYFIDWFKRLGDGTGQEEQQSLAW